MKSLIIKLEDESVISICQKCKRHKCKGINAHRFKGCMANFLYKVIITVRSSRQNRSMHTSSNLAGLTRHRYIYRMSQN